MEATPESLPDGWRYKLLTGLVVPRPIAFVSSLSSSGIANIAPFSYFSIACHNPMAISFTITGLKPDRSQKDTLRNIQSIPNGGSGEFVVNIAVESCAEAMARCSTPVPSDVSEFDISGLTMSPSSVISPPRIAEAPACFECRTHAIVPIGQYANLVVGEVVYIHVRDDLIDGDGQINFDSLGAIGRLAGTQYCRITDRFELPDEGFFPSQSDKPIGSYL
ncbi:flavin reductase (DIM6/NTAB) family NADH-FMN oxidoreductase RutF [Undibacterium sp. GrIS 1.8]|uniref:flavin reductase family protein n=1 Tax=Undibacterium sp. GrIS 1.8 TaxID=3143934 RepID=UPI00339872AA